MNLKPNFSKWLPLYIVVSLLSVSCSTLRFKADDEPKITMKRAKSCRGKTIVHKDTVPFYICGLTPSEHVINLSDVAASHNAKDGLCDVEIEEQNTFVDQVLGCLTLGIYTPRSYQVKARRR